MTPVTWEEPGRRGRGARVVRTRENLAAALTELRAGGARVALVPTMGALHAGHLALVDRARMHADAVVLSIFVNPLQFGPHEDLARYPRSLSRDVERSGARGVDVVFAPDVAEMYPDGDPVVRVVPGPMGEGLCGARRPGHFEGVLTVVARLFGLVRPDLAVFGRKDAQQASLIRRMVRDLEMGIEVEVAPLVREVDGLALSSRNAYLTTAERARAPLLFRALREAAAAFEAGEREPAVLEARVRAALEDGGSPALSLEYATVVDVGTLERPVRAAEDHLLAAAVRLGSTRLLDNLVLGEPDGDPREEAP